jgi:hypothetical protein
MGRREPIQVLFPLLWEKARERSVRAATSKNDSPVPYLKLLKFEK